ncbi:MAG: citrate lyase acyl carrier protein [Propionibacteriaceae bacterium]
MRIEKDALAGTLESSDVLVKVAPSQQREITISSTVMAQFGDQIRTVVEETLHKLGVESGEIVVEDKGALDCTIRARVQAAVLRAQDEATIDWSTL